MEEFIKSLERNFTTFFVIVLTSVMSMIVYALKSKETPKEKIKNTFSGGIISCLLAYPTWLYMISMFPSIGAFWLVPITFVYTITGQFLPEFLQEVVPTLLRKGLNFFYKKKTGEDFDK